jgi:two-component system response regulator HydG
LEQEVAAGRFRPDLYYRLNVVGFHLPPLRERRAVIAGLASRFLRQFAAQDRPDVRRLTPEAMAALHVYDWPGNIRELRNVIQRAVVLCRGPDVEAHDLPEGLRRPPASPPPLACLSMGANPILPMTLAGSREEIEIQRISDALQRHGNNRQRAAAELGISRVTLYKKLHKYGLMDLSA